MSCLRGVLLSRVLWVILMLVAAVLFTATLYSGVSKYLAYPTQVSTGIAGKSPPFPAISVCNTRGLNIDILNKINQMFVEDNTPRNHINSSEGFIQQYMKIVAKFGPLWYEYQEEYPAMFQEIFSRISVLSNIHESTVAEASAKKEHFIANCQFAGKDCSMTGQFKSFFDPHYLNCFTYESKEDEDIVSEGIDKGLSLVLFVGNGLLKNNKEIRIMPGIHESKSAVSGMEGIRLVIHPRNTKPFPSVEGYDVPAGFSASLGIEPKSNHRLQAPYGNCMNKNPFQDDDSFVYRRLSCLKSCVQSYVIDQCDCYDPSLPKTSSTSGKSCFDSSDFPKRCMSSADDTCREEMFKLYKKIECSQKAKAGFSHNSEQSCNCGKSCNEVAFDVSYSLSKWPASGYEGDAAYFDTFYVNNFKGHFQDTPMFKIVDDYFTDSNRADTMKDFARVNVYVESVDTLMTTEKVAYTFAELLNDLLIHLFVAIIVFVIGLIIITKDSSGSKESVNFA